MIQTKTGSPLRLEREVFHIDGDALCTWFASCISEVYEQGEREREKERENGKTCVDNQSYKLWF